MSAGVSHVFLSYASADRERALTLVTVLERIGVRVWVDRSGIAGGASYGPEIVAAIRESGALLLCCSAAAFASRNVRQEVALAWKHERSILPLLLEPAEIPDELAYWLEAAQWIELLDRPEDRWLPEVVHALQRLGVAVHVTPAASTEGRSAPAVMRLPTPLTALLGRDTEVRQITELLASHRLVTLTGPGGVGKTRLAIEAARAATEAFPGGVTFVDLAPVRDPGLMLSTVAQALGVSETSGAEIADTLSAVIGQNRLLLVLDNFEQILDAAPAVATLLAACARLAVLITSRAPIAVRGERVVPVEPLAVPDAGGVSVVTASPGVALFIDRAKAARPGLEPDHGDLETIAAICRRLDGLPLAIELAAARVKLLSPQALLVQMQDRLTMLTGGARDLPTRQQTMRDAIAWGYDLLGAEAAAVFRRLGIFVGGFDLESAAAVADREVAAITELLEALLDQSLVRWEEGADGSPRFGMLETIREFALEQLVANGEQDEIADRHAAYFAALVQRAETELWDGTLDAACTIHINTEQANIRAALGWLTANDPIAYVRMAGPLGAVWYRYGHLAEGRRWLDRALEIAEGLGDALPAADHVNALIGSGLICQMQGELAPARALLEQGLARARAAGDDWRAAIARSFLGGVLVSGGQYDEAKPLFELGLAEWQALAQAPALPPWQVAGRQTWAGIALFHLGLVAYAGRDWDRAVQLLTEAVRLYVATGEEIAVSDPLHYLALIACERGEFGEAASIITDVLRRLRLRGSESALADGLADVATLAVVRGDMATAARFFGAAARLLEVGGGTYSLPGRDTYERAEASARHELTEALWFGEFAMGRAMPLDQALVEADRVLSTAAKGEGTGRP